MTALGELMAKGTAAEHSAPWPRAEVKKHEWMEAIAGLAAGDLTLMGLWGDPRRVHMMLSDTEGGIGTLTLAALRYSYPSVGATHPPAIRLERAIRDLFGLAPEGLDDTRPWLDHGKWDLSHPLGSRPEPGVAQRYTFLPVEGDSLHQIPVGPVHAGIIEPGHFRFTASGETVVRLEERLGYVHKGIEGLMRRADPLAASRLAGRTSGDSTVAYQLAFARAYEAAAGIAVPTSAVWLRALMAELERLANHFGDIGAICNDASFSLMHAHTGMLREEVLRTADGAFGHRLMRDCIVPGGVAVDLNEGGWKAIEALLGLIRRRFPPLVELYDNTASLQDRTVSTGILKPELASRFGAGGFVGRASGRGVDARKRPGYAPYDELSFDVPVLSEGDVNARVWIRIREIEQSLALIEQILGRLPNGQILADTIVPVHAGEGAALVEGFRGDILVWLAVEADGRVARCHLRDPSWFHWPLLEAVIEGNIVADFPLCNKSFNCSYSGHDL